MFCEKLRFRIEHNKYYFYICIPFYISLYILRHLIALFFCFAVVFATPVFSQRGGNYSHAILGMKTSARTAALSADFLSVYDKDINTAISNPSLISRDIHNKIALNYINAFDGINSGTASYSRTFERAGSFAASVQYINYGKLTAYSEEEVEEGTFRASDLLLSIGWGRRLDSNFSIGANFKPLFSFYESYSAVALALDIAGNYMSDDKSFIVSLLARNIGFQLKTFDGTSEKIPFELALGLSKKLKNAPFRFYFNATNLQKWDLRYEDPLFPNTTTDLEGNVSEQSGGVKFFDNLFRHTVFGVELALKSFYLRIGYNYRQSKEGKVTDGLGFSGFGYGFGLRIKKFDIAYARNNYHLGQAPNFITVSTDLSRFMK